MGQWKIPLEQTEPLLQFELARHQLNQFPNMSAMTREEILDELISMGELPPQSWSNAEMKLRMEELRIAKGLNPNPRAKEKAPLRQWMIRLNAASSKKQDLVDFLREELKMAISGNDTIATLKKKGIMAIYQFAPTSPMDPVGFGAHAALHYQELKQTQPEYCKWVLQTAQEGNSDPRMARLASWLLKDQESQPASSGDQTKPYPITREELVQMGYLRQKSVKPKAKPVAAPSEISGTFSDSSSTRELMANLVTAVKDLTEEVQELKESKPRKKQASDVGSYEMM